MRNFLIIIAVFSLALLGAFAWIGAMNKDTFIGLGAWGDFFGGVANPILTFLTFICVLGTLWLQREELGLTRQELSRSADALERQIESSSEQKRQNIFFQMLSLHNELIASIDLHHSKNKTLIASGRDCFRAFYTRLSELYKEEVGKNRYDDQMCIERSYKIFWNKHQLELGHYCSPSAPMAQN